MKAVKVLFFTAVLLLGVNTAMAQAKLGHIDVATLISLMPETKKANTQMETMSNGFKADYDKMVTEYQNLAQKYQNEAASQSDAMNQTCQGTRGSSAASANVCPVCTTGSGKEIERTDAAYFRKSTRSDQCSSQGKRLELCFQYGQRSAGIRWRRSGSDAGCEEKTGPSVRLFFRNIIPQRQSV